MRKRPAAFTYDFEEPVAELDQRIGELAEGEDSDEAREQIRELEQQREKLLEQMVANLTPYQRVKLARHPLRPQPLDYLKAIFEDFIELHGDRHYGDDRAIVTGFCRLAGRRLVVIAIRKGHTTEERMRCNFGMPNPEGYRKALLKMRLAEKFSLPLLCLIDTPGAAAAEEAEARGEAMAIAENIFHMSGLRTPIVVLVTGEGCSGGALGIGVGDRFSMLENAYYSVISPESCSPILWRDGEHAPEAAQALKLTATDVLELGIIDEFLKEPIGGAHRDPEAAAETVKDYLLRTFDELSHIPMDELLEQRYRRYRSLGIVVEK